MLTPQLIQKITQAECFFVPQKWQEKDWRKTLCGAAFDTRTLKKEQIFFCWKGEQVEGKRADGHSYLKQLQKSPIRLVIIEKSFAFQEIFNSPAKIGFVILKVKNSREALHKIASFVAKNFSGKIVAVTGSSGKTTAKNWLATVLAKKYKVLESYGSFNNLIGCPISLLSLKKENLVVLEMGTSEKGEIAKLVNIIQPHYSVLLNVGLAHLKYFKNLKTTYQEKTAIFSSSRLKRGFYSSSITPKPKQKKLSRFGAASSYNCDLLKINLKKKKTLCKIQFKQNKEELDFSVLGYHLKETISMLLAVADALGLSWQQIKTRLKKLSPVAGRMKILARKNNRFIIDDSYNANPNSVINLLNTVALCTGYKKIVVIGFLAELEKDLKTTVKYLKKNIPKGIDKIYFSGKTGKILAEQLSKLNSIEFAKIESTSKESTSKESTSKEATSKESTRIEFIGDKANLLQKIKKEFTKNSVLAIKGSRVAKLENLLSRIV